MKVKDKLIEQIEKIENEELMSSISSMLSILNEEGIFELDDNLKDELNQRSKKIAEGEFILHEKVVEKFSK